MEETNRFRIFERRVVRKIYLKFKKKICGHVKEGECWRMRTY